MSSHQVDLNLDTEYTIEQVIKQLTFFFEPRHGTSDQVQSKQNNLALFFFVWWNWPYTRDLEHSIYIYTILYIYIFIYIQLTIVAIVFWEQ